MAVFGAGLSRLSLAGNQSVIMPPLSKVAFKALGKYAIRRWLAARGGSAYWHHQSKEPCPLSVESEELRRRVRTAIAAQAQTNVNVLSSLHAVLDDLGYIPDMAIEEVADFTGTTINEVWGVASFYTNFRFTPPGDNVVEICWGPTCHLLGAPQILSAVMADLGLEDEGETEDNRVSLKYNTCLGACSQAPVMMVNHRLEGRISVDSALERVSDLDGNGGGH